MRNRIVGSIGILWGGGILVAFLLGGGGVAGGSYGAGQIAGLLLGVLMLAAGIYYVVVGDTAK